MALKDRMAKMEKLEKLNDPATASLPILPYSPPAVHPPLPYDQNHHHHHHDLESPEAAAAAVQPPTTATIDATMVGI